MPEMCLAGVGCASRRQMDMGNVVEKDECSVVRGVEKKRKEIDENRSIVISP